MSADLRHVLARTEQRVRELQQRLTRSEFERLSLLIERSIARNDRETWAQAVADRIKLGVSVEQVECPDWLGVLREAGAL